MVPPHTPGPAESRSLLERYGEHLVNWLALAVLLALAFIG